MKTVLFAAALATVGAVPALAQDAAAPAAAPTAAAPAAPAAPAGSAMAAGATVYGPDGQPVGTIDKVEGGNAVLNTGNMIATLPLNAFGSSDRGPTITLNKADLEAAIGAANQQAAAALDAALVAGTQVYTVDGTLVGPVKSLEADGLIVVEHASGPLSLKKDQLAMQGDKLTVLATAADLQAAVSAQPGA